MNYTTVPGSYDVKDRISWADLNKEEQRAIALLAAEMPIKLCDAAAIAAMKRVGLVKGCRLTLRAEKLRKSRILAALAF